jgi:hypothetical protein
MELYRLNSHLTLDKMIRTWLRILPLLLLIGSGILMLEGLPLLNETLFKGSELLWGTLVAWVGIIMLPFSILMGIRIIRKPISRVYRFYHRVFLLLSLLSITWGLVSYLLAGNWAYTFVTSSGFKGSEPAYNLFLYFTTILISLTLLFLIIFGIHHLIIKYKKK